MPLYVKEALLGSLLLWHSDLDHLSMQREKNRRGSEQMKFAVQLTQTCWKASRLLVQLT